MTTYRISNRISGMDLGTFSASSEEDALDAMAQDAGYENYATAQAVAPVGDDELAIEEEE